MLRDFREIDKFSKGMIFAVIAVVNMMSRYLPRIGSLMENTFNEEEIGHDMKEIYFKITRPRRNSKGIEKIRN